MFLGKRLRTIRESKHVSLMDLDIRTGFSRGYWSRFESGDQVPSIKSLEKWAAALEVPLYELFFEEEKRDLPLLTRPVGTHAIDSDTWQELSAACERVVDTYGVVGPMLELAKDKIKQEQLGHLMEIRAILNKGHLALTKFASLWTDLDSQLFEGQLGAGPTKYKHLLQAARQNSLPETRPGDTLTEV